MSSTNQAIPSTTPGVVPPGLAAEKITDPAHNVEAGSHSSTIVDNSDDPAHPHQEAVGQDTKREALNTKPEEKGEDEFEVKITPNDPEHPHNWSRLYRWYLTGIGGLLVMNAYVRSSRHLSAF